MRRFQCCCALLLVLLFWSVGTTSAQEPAWTIISRGDGLLADSISALSAAPGSTHILIGTNGGLNVWDGRRLRMYSAGNGLAEGRITAVAEHDGQLWAGSWGGGLATLRGASWRVWRAESSPLPGDWVSALAPGPTGLWVGTYGGGLALYDSGAWTVYRHEDTPLPSDYVTVLLAEPAAGAGDLWIGTERAGLARLQADGTWRRYALPFEHVTHVTALVAHAGDIWVGTPAGLAVLDPDTGQWLLPLDGEALDDARVTALAADEDGVWIGTYRGLVRWQDGRWTRLGVADGLPGLAVNSLTVDAAGRLWVGTLTGGVAVRGLVPLPPTEKLPVVMVHGWRGPDSDLLRDSEFWFLARWLRQDGFAPYYVTGISPDNTLHQNAARLREVIATVRQESGAERVHVVAFSMGGLNTRAYTESTLYADDVARVFILGTPHRGEHLWRSLLLWEHLAWTDQPSALELLPLHARLFNRTHANAWRVPYVLVAGDARDEAVPTLFQELPASDGLVSTWSALGPPGMVAERRVTRDIHAWGGDTIRLDLPSLLYPRQTYDAHIRPFLFGVAEADGAGTLLPVEGYGEPDRLPRTGLRAGTLAAGETASIPLPVDPTREVRFYVRWKGPAPEVRLVDPTGRTIDPDAAEDADDVEYLALDFADFANYIVTDPAPGIWRIELVAGEDGPAVDYVAYAALRSALRFDINTDAEWYRAGQPLRVAVTPTGAGDATAETATVGGEFYLAGTEPQSLVLDGAASGEPDDPAYRAIMTLPAESGYGVLLTLVTGTVDGHLFERGQAVVVGVAGDEARLGTCALVPGDTLADGRLDGLVARVGVEVERAGDYAVSLRLDDATGAVVARVVHPVHLDAGSREVVVHLPARLIVQAERDGPYRLGQVTLMGINGPGILLDERADACRSERLNSSDFGMGS